MKKILFIILFIISVLQNSNAQKWEFNYFALEIGINHGFAGAPDTLNNFFVKTDNGDVVVFPNSNLEYTPGFNAGLQFHHDFNNNSIGLVFGAKFTTNGFKAGYTSSDKKISLKQTNRVYGVAIPLFIKLSSELYNNQAYFYAGAECQLNFNAYTIEKLKDESQKRRVKIDDGALNKIVVPVFIGFNYKLFNMRATVITKNFLNRDYQMPVGEGKYAQTIKPYKTMPSALIYIQTGFVIPISQWTKNRSYIMSKIF